MILSSWSYLLLLLLLVLATVTAEAGTCILEDSQCQTDEKSLDEDCSENEPSSFLVVNRSQYRADIYWDDGMFGVHLGILEAEEGAMNVKSVSGNSFFVTKHGVKEGLFDLETDEPHRYTFQVRGDMFEIPANAAPSSNPCQDRFSICPTEAAAGKCAVAPGWMIVHCCKSCDDELDASRLIDHNVRCTKERLNITEPAWQPGDLNKRFESWVKEDKFQHYEPQVISSPNAKFGGIDGPWVLTFDNFFTEEEAQAFIEAGNEAGFERSTDRGKLNALGEQEKVTSQNRTSTNAWCMGVPKGNFESFQILKYQLNQFYLSHHDSSDLEFLVSGHRILTFFLYLTDVEEGGETKFNSLDVQAKPKQGRALVWPSVNNEDPTTWDPRTYHEALPVTKGTKFAANHWIHLYDHERANKWGCTGSFS
ncbi:MAG: hypothetical protein SGBAC_010060 [Bacillariaceae sp.]